MGQRQLERIYLTYLFNSPPKLYRQARAEGVSVTLAQLRTFLRDHELAQVFPRPHRPRRSQQTGLLTFNPRQYFQADLLIYDRRRYRGFKNILVVIDVYSRYAAIAVPLRSKTGKETAKALKTVLDEMGRPETLMTDKGREFLNRPVQSLLGEVRWIVSDEKDTSKNVDVESFNKTVRSLLHRYMIVHQTPDGVSALPKVITNFSSTVHSATKETPASIFRGRPFSKEIHRLIKTRFHRGDLVRLSTKRTLFQKGSEQTLSKAVHEILSSRGTRFVLRDILTGEEEEEPAIRSTTPATRSRRRRGRRRRH